MRESAWSTSAKTVNKTVAEGSAPSSNVKIIPSSPLARIAAAARNAHSVKPAPPQQPVLGSSSWPVSGGSGQKVPKNSGEQRSKGHGTVDSNSLHPAKTPPTADSAPSFAAIAARIAAAPRNTIPSANNECNNRADCQQAGNAEELKSSDVLHPQQVRELQESFAELTRPIVLIGPMAAGKTYIGTHLARFYGYEFLDADQLIVERYGEISEIFEIFGEAYFRDLEVKIIEEVLTSPSYRNTVFSLGGGAPMTDAAAQLLRGQNVVYILVDALTVTPRITGSKTRPLLQPNPVERWIEIFEHRRERYESLATYTLDARGERSIGVMAAEIQDFVLASRKENLNDRDE